MSNLGDQIQDAIDEFNNLNTGADWRSTQETMFLPSLQTALDGAVAEDALDESVRDTVAGFLLAAGSVSLDYDDAGDTLTISADVDTDTQLTDSQVAAALAGQSIGDNSPLSSINTDQASIATQDSGTVVDGKSISETNGVADSPLGTIDVGDGDNGKDRRVRYPLNFKASGDESAHETVAQLVFGDVPSLTGGFSRTNRGGDITLRVGSNDYDTGVQLIDGIHIDERGAVHAPNGKITTQGAQVWDYDTLIDPVESGSLTVANSTLAQSTGGSETYAVVDLGGTGYCEITTRYLQPSSSDSSRWGVLRWFVTVITDSNADNYRILTDTDIGGGSHKPSVAVDQSTGEVSITKPAAIDGPLMVEAYDADVLL